MRAGRLKNRVSLQNFTETQSNTGFPTKTWATVATVWAATEALRGKEDEFSDELVTSMVTKVIVRYSKTISAIDTKWRVLFGTRIFSVESVMLPADRSGSNSYIELMCMEGKKDGG
jgi:SPP1 family predicted phage head-tail adaptor